MAALFETVVDPVAQAEVLRRRRYGVIEMIDGRLKAVHLRPWPRRGSIFEAYYFGRWWHRRRSGDRALLYYSQPWGHANYLALAIVFRRAIADWPRCAGRWSFWTRLPG